MGKKEAMSVTCCVKGRRRIPSCELSRVMLPCWVSAAERSYEGWTVQPLGSHGQFFRGMSFVDLSSFAVCTNQSHFPPIWNKINKSFLTMNHDSLKTKTRILEEKLKRCMKLEKGVDTLQTSHQNTTWRWKRIQGQQLGLSALTS